MRTIQVPNGCADATKTQQRSHNGWPTDSQSALHTSNTRASRQRCTQIRHRTAAVQIGTMQVDTAGIQQHNAPEVNLGAPSNATVSQQFWVHRVMRRPLLSGLVSGESRRSFSDHIDVMHLWFASKENKKKKASIASEGPSRIPAGATACTGGVSATRLGRAVEHAH